MYKLCCITFSAQWKKTYQQDSGISNLFLVIASSSWILNHSEFVQSEWESIPQQKWVVWILSITWIKKVYPYNKKSSFWVVLRLINFTRKKSVQKYEQRRNHWISFCKSFGFNSIDCKYWRRDSSCHSQNLRTNQHHFRRDIIQIVQIFTMSSSISKPLRSPICCI